MTHNTTTQTSDDWKTALDLMDTERKSKEQKDTEQQKNTEQKSAQSSVSKEISKGVPDDVPNSIPNNISELAERTKSSVSAEKKLKFAHLADCHLGGWRHPKLRELGHEAFRQIISKCIAEHVDFILIAGDFFNTSFPSIDTLHFAVAELMRCKKQTIPVYAIPGSHDYSSSGKTMLDVLERAGLIINVMRSATVEGSSIRLIPVKDEKTGVHITGMLGRRGGLDKHLYQFINHEELESIEGKKIFMFHCALTECKPKSLEHVDGVPVSSLPRNFSYYAGGHVHVREHKNFTDHVNVVYPGPTFPNSFAELEELETGSYVLVTGDSVEHRNIEAKPIVRINIRADGKSAEQCQEELGTKLRECNVIDKIVLLRLHGVLALGKPSDIRTAELIEECMNRGAYVVLKNSGQLSAKEMQDIRVPFASADELTSRIIEEMTGKHAFSKEAEKEAVHALMKVLSQEQQDGEKSYDYEARIIQEARKNIGVLSNSKNTNGAETKM